MTPVHPGVTSGPAWQAFCAKVRGHKTAEEKRVPPAKLSGWMRKNLETGCWELGVPSIGHRTQWLTMGEQELGTALKLFDDARLELLARANRPVVDGVKVPSCSEIVDAWLAELAMDQARNTVSIYGHFVRQLLKRLDCAQKPLALVSRQGLYDFVNDPATKEATRSVRLAAVRSFYLYAAAQGHIVGNIALTLRINQSMLTIEQRERIPAIPFTDEEYRRVMASPEVPQFWRWATALGYWLGLRFVDVCRLEWSSLGEDFAVLYPQKTGRKLILPLHDPLIGSGELKALFDEMRAAINPKETFCFPDRNRQHSRLAASQYVKVLRQCGIEGKSFHGWRHNFRLRMTQSGKSIEEVARLMGHSDITTTWGYGRATAQTSSQPPASASAQSG